MTTSVEVHLYTKSIHLPVTGSDLVFLHRHVETYNKRLFLNKFLPVGQNVTNVQFCN